MSSTTSAPSPPQLSSGSDASPRAACLNCGTPLHGHFCSHCGQRDVPPHPSLKELGGEAFQEFSGWDGKFVQTVKLLVLKPGELTVRFLDGARARFISPVRLYLTASLVFFLFVGQTPASNLKVSYQATPSAQKRQLTAADTAIAPPILKPMIRQAAMNPTVLVAGVVDALPRGLFALLPVFAAILMIFYRGRKFPEHLYFAIHVHAFMFIVLDVVMSLQRIVRNSVFSLVMILIPALWIPLYMHLALVRVYGGSQSRTFLKEIGISALYAAASVPMIVILAIWVSWRMS